MNPIQTAIRARLDQLPAELAPLRDAGLRYLRYCSAITVGDTAVLVAHQPWVGPEAYLITLYPGVRKAWLPKYEKAAGLRIPAAMKRFLAATNGCEAFGLSIYGIPPSMMKVPGLLDRSTRQCRDLGAANRNWKGEYPVDPAHFHFGGRDYTDDELAGYFLDGGGRIHAVTQGGREVGTWSDLTAFLRDELAASEAIARAETPEEWW
jgi:hypothetical protein